MTKSAQKYKCMSVSHWIPGATALLALIGLSSTASAQSLSDALGLPDNVWVGGRLTQGTGVYFDRYGDDKVGIGPSQFVAQIQGIPLL